MSVSMGAQSRRANPTHEYTITTRPDYATTDRAADSLLAKQSAARFNWHRTNI